MKNSMSQYKAFAQEEIPCVTLPSYGIPDLTFLTDSHLISGPL